MNKAKASPVEKTHEYLKTKQKLLLLLRWTKKRKIIKELANGIEKGIGIGILIWANKEISEKKSRLGVRSKVYSEKKNPKRFLVSLLKMKVFDSITYAGRIGKKKWKGIEEWKWS
jgi:hypothetical protein